MTIADILLIDFDAEAVSTRRVLERVPLDKVDWKPHAKSFPLSALASHVSTLASFGNTILTTEEADIATMKFPVHQVTTIKALLETASGLAAEIRTNLAAMSDEDLTKTWTLRYGDHVISATTRMFAYRTMFSII